MWLMGEEAYFEKVKNWNLREDYLKDLDVISSTPSIPFNASSILVVIPSSISFGDAPGKDLEEISL